MIACINFVNLSTARSVHRTREVGVRKAIGAQRLQLAYQFFGESSLLVAASFGLALGLAYLVLPKFNALAHTALTLDVVQLVRFGPYLGGDLQSPNP